MSHAEFNRLSAILTQMFEINQQLMLSQTAMLAVLSEEKGFDDRYRQKRKDLLSGALGKQLQQDSAAFSQVLQAAKAV